MLYIQDLESSEYVNTNKLLNLVLDQTERTKDLFYKVEIFSSVTFKAIKLGKNFSHK